MQAWLSPYGVAVLWAPLGLSAVVLASLAGIYRLGRTCRWLWPAGWGRRLAAAALLCVALGSMTGLATLAPVSRRLRKLHGGIGTRVPDVAFRLVEDGAARHLADFKGNVVVLNIWATWCPSCRHELPAFNKLQAAYRDRGLVVLNLSDENRDELREFSKARPVDAINGCVGSFDWEWFRPGNMRPFTPVIDRDGYYRQMAPSGEVTFEQLDAMVLDYL